MTELLQRWRQHWPEYLLDGAALGIFMISASVFTVLIEHPFSPVNSALPPGVRHVLLGLAMGGTNVALIYSPLGRRSGAHMNPAVTLTFLRLGKVSGHDSIGYVLGQFAGGTAGMLLAAWSLGDLLGDPNVRYVATVPGPAGAPAAFAAELLISFLLMSVVLVATNQPRLARYTGWMAGACVAAFITFEAPFSGMSMNPARTFASAVIGGTWTAWWIYFVAPPLGMLLAALAYSAAGRATACAKLHHAPDYRCIFCGHAPS